MSFITKYEYGQMLYENPRGIGCIKCHGKNGKGIIIAKYSEEQKDKTITTEVKKTGDITVLSLEDFKKVLNVKKSESLIMPTYFLTNEEVESIYYYITNIELKEGK